VLHVFSISYFSKLLILKLHQKISNSSVLSFVIPFKSAVVEVATVTLGEIRFNVAWNILREVAECGVFLIPFLLEGTAKAVSCSTFSPRWCNDCCSIIDDFICISEPNDVQVSACLDHVLADWHAVRWTIRWCF
jgi:hypothetical protein